MSVTTERGVALLLFALCCPGFTAIGTVSDHVLSRHASSALSFARTRSGGFQGTWVERSQSFEWSQDNDFLLTWDVPAMRTQVNVTASDAVRANGPLTLLYALSLCQGEGALASFLERASSTRRVRLHVVGVNSSLEPSMEWDNFLVGPLSEKQRRLVEAFALPVTPFAGMDVAVLFNGNNRPTDSMQQAKRRGRFPEGYSESYTSGLYHAVVDEAPDLVLAINPGFAHYPAAWWSTLSKLRSLRVPIIATGYSGAFGLGGSSNIRAVYEHGRLVQPQYDGHKLHLPSADCRSLRGCLQKLSLGKVKVHRFKADLANFLRPKKQCAQVASTVEPDTVCRDLDGNAFLAGRAGYAVRLAAEQPFTYCDAPAAEHCQSSAVVSVFEPTASAASRLERAVSDKEPPPQEIPVDVIRQDLFKMMNCHSQMHPRTERCLTDYIQEQPPAVLKKTFVMTHLLNSALRACQRSWDDDY